MYIYEHKQREGIFQCQSCGKKHWTNEKAIECHISHTKPVYNISEKEIDKQ